MEQERTIKDVFHVAGDAPDPAGELRSARGFMPGYDLAKGALGHPMLLYRPKNGPELILEADVFNGPDGQYIYLICPRCLATGHTNQLRIRQGIKAFSYDPAAVVPTFPGWTAEQMRHAFPKGAGGLLSVEPFSCTWEEHPDLQRGFGFEQCGWRVVIERNVVRDA